MLFGPKKVHLCAPAVVWEITSIHLRMLRKQNRCTWRCLGKKIDAPCFLMQRFDFWVALNRNRLPPPESKMFNALPLVRCIDFYAEGLVPRSLHFLGLRETMPGSKINAPSPVCCTSNEAILGYFKEPLLQRSRSDVVIIYPHVWWCTCACHYLCGNQEIVNMNGSLYQRFPQRHAAMNWWTSFGELFMKDNKL